MSIARAGSRTRVASVQCGVQAAAVWLVASGRSGTARSMVSCRSTSAADGLTPSSKGARIVFSGAKRTVVDGPFAETKELIAGFWIWQVKSMQEAIEWAKRCPNPTGDQSVLELRPVFESEDFGAELTPELRAQEERLAKQILERQKAGKH